MEGKNKLQDVDSVDQTGGKGEAPTKSRPRMASVVFLSLNVLLFVVAVVVLEIQLVTLRREVDNLRAELREGSKPKQMRKRSLTEVRRQSGINAAQLQGVLAYQLIEKQGKIGPWTAKTTDDAFITLRNKRTEIEINQSGVYYIYAQVYYLTSEVHNSFQIMSYNGTEERKNHQNLVTCSSQGRNSMGELSCYTGFISSLHSGQRLYLNQVEQNRIIHLANGCSYFGVVLLRKNGALKPQSGEALIVGR